MTDKTGRQGSMPQQVKVLVEVVPTMGVIDNGSDINIMGEDLLKRAVAAAIMCNSRLKKVDESPRTHDGQPFILYGRIDIDISFEGTTMQPPVYVSLGTAEPLSALRECLSAVAHY